MPTKRTERQDDWLIQPSKGTGSYYPVPDIQGLVDMNYSQVRIRLEIPVHQLRLHRVLKVISIGGKDGRTKNETCAESSGGGRPVANRKRQNWHKKGGGMNLFLPTLFIVGIAPFQCCQSRLLLLGFMV